MSVAVSFVDGRKRGADIVRLWPCGQGEKTGKQEKKTNYQETARLRDKEQDKCKMQVQQTVMANAMWSGPLPWSLNGWCNVILLTIRQHNLECTNACKYECTHASMHANDTAVSLR